MSSLDETLLEEQDALRSRFLHRRLRPLAPAGPHLVRPVAPDGGGGEPARPPLVNFASNDYLGLSTHPALARAVRLALGAPGSAPVGSGASRLVTGTHPAHLALESALATFKQAPAALAFPSGYTAALGAIPSLVGAGDFVLLDKLAHASLIDAARLSGATLRVFPHNHLGKLARLLSTLRSAHPRARILIVTEGVFSMDGDACPLPEIVALKNAHQAWLLLDEAHSIGLLGPQGRGLAHQHGLHHEVEIHLGTLSKAAGAAGGYLCGSRTLVDHLVNHARSLIYTTAPPPMVAAAAVAALEVLGGPEGDKLRSALRRNVSLLFSQLPPGLLTETPAAAILPLPCGVEEVALLRSVALESAGFLVPAIRYPTVAKGKARLRLAFSATHTEEQVNALANVVRREFRQAE